LKGLEPITFYALSALSVFVSWVCFFWGLWARNKTLLLLPGRGRLFLSCGVDSRHTSLQRAAHAARDYFGTLAFFTLARFLSGLDPILS
jgi:hypothetical protein